MRDRPLLVVVGAVCLEGARLLEEVRRVNLPICVFPPHRRPLRCLQRGHRGNQPLRFFCTFQNFLKSCGWQVMVQFGYPREVFPRAAVIIGHGDPGPVRPYQRPPICVIFLIFFISTLYLAYFKYPPGSPPKKGGFTWEGESIGGLASTDRNNKATLLFTAP